MFFCRSWLAGEPCLEASGAAIAGKPAPTGGGGRLRCFSVGAGLPASFALKPAVLPSRASPLPQGDGRIAMLLFCRSWLASELCLKSAAPPSRASPLPQKEGRVTVLVCRSWLASELWLEVSGAAIAGKPAPTRGGGGLRCFSVGAGLPASSALKTAATPSRASPLPQWEGADCDAFL